MEKQIVIKLDESDDSVKVMLQLEKGKRTPLKHRFTLYEITFDEWYTNGYFRSIVSHFYYQGEVERGSFDQNVMNDGLSIYILRDETQPRSSEYFIKYPYTNYFIQQYTKSGGHASYSQQYGTEESLKFGVINTDSDWRKKQPVVSYDYTTAIIRNNKICIIGTLGSFSVGYDMYLSDEKIEKLISKYGYVMLESHESILRFCFNKATREYIIYTHEFEDYRYNKLYILNVANKTYRECVVDDVKMYKDGGTTNIDFTDNDVKYHLHLVTPLAKERVHTLNEIPCIDNVSKDEYDDIYKFFYEIVGFKLIES